MQLHNTPIAELTAFVETLTEEQYQPVQRKPARGEIRPLPSFKSQ